MRIIFQIFLFLILKSTISISNITISIKNSTDNSIITYSGYFDSTQEKIIINNKRYDFVFNFNEHNHNNSTSEIIIYISIIIVLILFAGIMSGLTVGYLSIDPLHLEIRMLSNNKNDFEKCKRINYILHDKHRLLVTLLVSNAAAMEALPLFLDRLLPSWAAIIISTTLVLFIGEVIPQAICTGKNQINIASALAPMTRILIWILTPLNYPLGKILDCLLGRHIKQRFINSELKNLIELHKKSKLKKKNNRHQIGEENKEKEEKINEKGKKNHNKNEIHEELLSNQEVFSSESEVSKSILIRNDKENNSTINNTELEYNDDFGLIQEQVNVMITIIEIKSRVIREIMTPIKRVFSINLNKKVNMTLIDEMINMKNPYIIVYETNRIDNINNINNANKEKKYIGYVVIEDLLKKITYMRNMDNAEIPISFDLKDFIYKGLNTHSYKSILFLYKYFLKTNNKLCLISHSHDNKEIVGVCSKEDMINYLFHMNPKGNSSVTDVMTEIDE